MKKSLFLFGLAVLLIATACGGKTASNTSNRSKTADVKTGVAPVADPEVAVIEMENASAYGTITVELYSNIAPKMVERFKELAREGFYNGTTFHRVSAQVVQGGDPNSKDNDPTNDGMGESPKPDLPAEFSDVPFERAMVGAARLGTDVNSANCQFFITMQRMTGWDRNYTVFGKVIDGMRNADVIGGVPKNGERPMDPIKIKTITIRPR